MKHLSILMPLILSPCTVIADDTDEWQLYFLGGQSNMDGYGWTRELPKELADSVPGAMIFDGRRIHDDQPGGGIGLWSQVEPGHGMGFDTDGSDNRLSDRFGPELSFATTLTGAGQKVAIIKYSFGGTALFRGAGYGNWDPSYEGSNHFDNAMATIDNALQVSDINGDGRPDKLVPAGIIWMQGEADAQFSQASADAYLGNLTTLMSLLREKLGGETLPVVIGRINDSFMLEDGAPTQPYIETVHTAQKEFTDNDVCATWVTETEDYAFSDDQWHYKSEGYIRMGVAFAEAAMAMPAKCLSGSSGELLKLSDISFIEGHWVGKGKNAPEEQWYPPQGGILPGFFRWTLEKPVFELLNFVETDAGITFYFKHFNTDLSTWEPDEANRYIVSRVENECLYMDRVSANQKVPAGISYCRLEEDTLEFTGRGDDETWEEAKFKIRYGRAD